MDTHRYTLQQLLMQPQRLVVPLFQRGYAWIEDVQWRPLWEDVCALADGILVGKRTTHFIGAIVLQSSLDPAPGLTQWEVIDGQQRLTTLQILADAVSSAIAGADGQEKGIAKLSMLTENPEAFISGPDDRFKLWPTNRDREAYREVMAAPTPVNYGTLEHRGHRLISAHAFFTHSAGLYLREASDSSSQARADALVIAITECLELVGITLTAQENSQAIFETMNARMTPLQPTDLIKNYLFQKVTAEGANVETVYKDFWQEFEDPFWEKEIAQGRYVRPRFTVFMNHWLVMKLAEEVSPAEVFRTFKKYAESLEDRSAVELLKQIRASADAFRTLSEFADGNTQLNGVALSVYRLTAADVSIVWPVMLWLTEAKAAGLDDVHLSEALDALESWVMRRILIGATASNYNRLLLEMLRRLNDGDPRDAGKTVRDYLRSQTSSSSFWPGDGVIRAELSVSPVYPKLTRARLRIILEALEDEARGFVSHHARESHSRMTRLVSDVEHVMPINWRKKWPLAGGDPEERDMVVQTLGNLALLPRRFNASISDEAWGTDIKSGKRGAFHKHSTDLLLRNVLELDSWDETAIRNRTELLIEAILRIWPVPAGHKGEVQWADPAKSVSLASMIDAGLLKVGQSLQARGSAVEKFARVLPSGELEVAGVSYPSPSAAARAARGTSAPVNGMWFWLADVGSLRSLGDLREAYVLDHETVTSESDSAMV